CIKKYSYDHTPGTNAIARATRVESSARVSRRPGQPGPRARGAYWRFLLRLRLFARALRLARARFFFFALGLLLAFLSESPASTPASFPAASGSAPAPPASPSGPASTPDALRLADSAPPRKCPAIKNATTARVPARRPSRRRRRRPSASAAKNAGGRPA